MALALIAWKKPNLLILDEPTNHLDMEVRDALLLAMQEFEGAVLLVSHDRYLLRHTVDNFWLVANGQVLNYDGDLADYQKHLSQINANDEPTSSIKTDDNKTKRQQAAELRTQLAPLKKLVTLAEKSMAKIEPSLVAIEQRLADPSIYEQSNKDELKAVLKQQGELREAMEAHEIEWMDAAERLEQAYVQYSY